jgi:hypothetical protein
MAGWRHVVELAMSGEDIGRLTDISRSRTERASRVERAQMLLGDNDGAAIDIGKKRFRASQVMGLARCNQELDWPASAVDPRVDFRREPTAASPHTAISTLFLTAETCW